MTDVMAKERLLDVFGGVDPRKWPRRLLTLDGFRQWAAEAIDGPTVVRSRRHGPVAVVTIYIPRCAPEIVDVLRAQIEQLIPVMLEVRFVVGVWTYQWNRLAAWIRGG